MRRAVVFVLVLASCFPFASAAWHGLGTSEPNTAFDRDAGRMPLEADTSVDARNVYFDVFPTMGGPASFSPANGLNANPNVGTIGSRIAPPGLVQYNAFLGIWKDCNLDGYIGLAEGGVQEYEAALLPANTPCLGRPFNDGTWVDEFLFIGMVDPCQYKDNAYRAQHCAGIPGVNDVPAFLNNPRVFFANDTFVWGDLQAPGARPETPCPLPPFARGTTAGPSTLLAVVDCQDGRAIQGALSQLPTQITGVLATRAPANLFGDPQNGKSGLLQQGTNDGAATVFDCSDPRANAVHDPTAPDADSRGSLAVDRTVDDPSGGPLSGNQGIPIVGQKTIFPARVRTEDDHGNVAWTAAVAPNIAHPTGSWWDAAAAAFDGAGPVGDCTAGTPNALQAAYPGGFVEADRAPLSDLRTASDVTMTFYRGYRGDSHVNDRLGTHDLPDDGGVEYTRNLYGGPLWMATSAVLAQPRAFDRSTLSPDAPLVTTFYAVLDPADVTRQGWGLRIPTTDPGVYGSFNCPDSTQGAAPANGWACDGASWYKAADGSSTMPRFAEGQRIGRLPGDPYHLLDVDCYDQSAGAVPALTRACA